MTPGLKNIPASIHDRLAHEARMQNRPFSELLQFYGMERFLDRLSRTKYTTALVLKGGLVFYAWGIPERRPTRDIDFLARLDNRRDAVADAILAAINVSVPDDGVEFDPRSLNFETTQVNADRNGVRAAFTGYLGRAQIPMQLDFGFSDEIAQAPIAVEYPAVLEGFPRPRLTVYPVEAVVAEKLHTMERFAAVPSRWQDYYDVWLISRKFEVGADSVARAIQATYHSRNTGLPTARPLPITEAFGRLYEAKWVAFLRRNNLDASTPQLVRVIRRLWSFLEEPILSLGSQKRPSRRLRWVAAEGTWR